MEDRSVFSIVEVAKTIARVGDDDDNDEEEEETVVTLR